MERVAERKIRMNPLDQITITGLRANAHHGVFDDERRNGQLFIVDVTVSLDFSKAAASDDRMAGPRDVKVLKYSSRGGQRPEVKTLRVLGNQRLTQGGKVKRAAAPKQISVKKRRQT